MRMAVMRRKWKEVVRLRMRVDPGEKRKAGKKILSFTICLAMILSALPEGSGAIRAYASPAHGRAAFETAVAAAEKGDAADAAYKINADTNYFAPMGILGAGDFAGGDGSELHPYLIENWTHLNNMRNDLDAYFELTADLDETTAGYDTLVSASGTSGAGWLPIGTEVNPFVGTLTGAGFTISGLYINRDDEKGLFGCIGSEGEISGLELEDVNVTGNNPYAGGLAGINKGSIDGCSSAGIVHSYSNVGGLVGYNSGTVTDSYAACSVDGNQFVGGLVGGNSGTVTDSYAACSVDGTRYIGGLVGYNSGAVTGCYAEGTTESSGEWVGGLAGVNSGSITDSHSAGSVRGSGYVGGLAGYNDSGMIEGSYATGDVNGGISAGGLVGLNTGGGMVRNSYATGSVGGVSPVGGLAGSNSSTIEYSYATGETEGVDNVGGLAGYSNHTITSCFATGAVTTHKDHGIAGGLVGGNEGAITSSYAAGPVVADGDNPHAGGLVGTNWTLGSAASSYYNITIAGQPDNSIGEPATSEEMICRSTFSGWDFTNIWTINEGVSYPYFQWGTPVPLPTPARVIINPSNLILADIGTPAPLTATMEFAGSSDTSVIWSTGDAGIADVDENGLVTPVSVGQTVITATANTGGYRGQAQVTVVTGHAIRTPEELNGIRSAMDQYYVLMNDISLTDYLSAGGGSYNSGAGWEPIGTTGSPFTGTLDGNGKTITGLRVNRPVTDYIGLFGSTGNTSVIKNVGLLNSEITGRQYTGSLAGCSEGEIINCSSAGIVTGGSLTLGADSGGLVGENDGSITGSHATCTVKARGLSAGGLAGFNSGTITNCYAVGTVDSNENNVGGLVGWNGVGVSRGVISNSYAAVDVDGAGYVGGLVGYNVGEITGSHATGTVNASSPNAGGLVGYSYGSIIVSASYATGNVTGTTYVGGLVGYDSCDTINSYATGAVTGRRYVGGLAGANAGEKITNCYATGDATGIGTGGSANRDVGGLVGLNDGGTIEKTYAAGKVTANSNAGGLVGSSSGGTVTGSFYNRQTSGRTDTGKGEPKTSVEMVQKATFTAKSWNFDAGSGIWTIQEGASYPYLRAPAPDSLPAPPALTGVTVSPAALSLTYGAGPVALTAIVVPDGALYDISWSSSDESVATVNAGGVMTPVGAGTATISAVTDIGDVTGSGTVTVNKKTLTVSGSFVADDKIYDGTTAASINAAGLTLTGIIAGDTGKVTLNAAAFDDADAGTGKTVSLTETSSLTGEKAGNYILSLTGAPTASAIITPKELTVGGSFTASGKSYDGTTAASINAASLTLPDVLADDAGQVILNAAAAFADAEAGENKPVSLAGASTLGGGRAGNYTLSLTGAPTASASITAKGLAVGGDFTADDKIYDGTTAASIDASGLTLPDVLADDAGQVTLNAVAAFDDANTGMGKTVSLTGASDLGGSKAVNYSLSLDGAPTTSAIITKRPIAITADAKSKIVGAADPDLTYRVTAGELIGEDTVAGALVRTTGEAIGSYVIHIGTLDAGLNYEIVFHEATFTINEAPSKHRSRGSGSSISGSYTFEIPKDFRSGKDGRDILTFDCSITGIAVPQNILSGIPEEEDKKAEIAISRGDKSSLPDHIKAAIGDRPLIRFTLLLNGVQTDWNNPDAPVTVSIPYTPTAEELANPEGIVIWYIDGGGNAVCVPNGRYDPATGTVTFDVTHFSDYAVVYNPVSFSDVAAGAWYGKAVSFIAARDITTGTGGGKFSPDAKLTRGQFLVMLMKAYEIVPDTTGSDGGTEPDGSPVDGNIAIGSPADNFADAGNTYYTGYLAAAKRLGISGGVGDNMFAPEREITRQEMFTLLYNALKAIGGLTPTGREASVGGLPAPGSEGPDSGDAGEPLSDFSDAGQIASWAMEALTFLTKTGTVAGSNGALAPLATTTRAEMAQVLYNLLGK